MLISLPDTYESDEGENRNGEMVMSNRDAVDWFIDHACFTRIPLSVCDCGIRAYKYHIAIAMSVWEGGGGKMAGRTWWCARRMGVSCVAGFFTWSAPG